MANSTVVNATVDEYLRVSSIAIAIYDYVWTLPTEYRLYRSQQSYQRLNRTCILFILNRYISAATIIISNIGFFRTFSTDACSHYFLVSPVFKVLAAMVTQIIMATRTYNISQRRTWVKYVLLLCWIFFTIIEFWSNIYQRKAVQTQIDGGLNCISGNIGSPRVAWVHYMVCIIFDAVTIGIACGYLYSYSPTSRPLAELLRRMIVEGIGYFIVMTTVNILNLIIYQKAQPDTQSSAASLGYVIAWVMGQRLLINHFEATEESKRTLDGVIALEDARDVNHALRSQFDGGFRLNLESRSRPGLAAVDHDLKHLTFDVRSTNFTNWTTDGQDEGEDVVVRVHIEQKVKVDRKGKSSNFMRETYTERRSMRDRASVEAGGTSSV